jgi:pimeloyl-ACP methyl ester carboxylesterase
MRCFAFEPTKMSDLFKLKPSFVETDGLKVRYVRAGRENGTPVLLTAPWPESLLAFHALWPSLTEAAPVIAVDLPGFGRSEGRPEVMSPASMGRFIAQFIEKLNIGPVHGVGPDVGTSALLFAAAASPELFESLVLGSASVVLEHAGGPVLEIIGAPNGAFDGVEGSDMAFGALSQLMRTPVREEAVEDYRLSSAGGRWAAAAQYIKSYAKDLPNLQLAIEKVKAPALVIAGREDPVAPPANADFLGRNLARSRVEFVESGHFVWQDAPDKYAGLLTEWIGGAYRMI